jgi:peptidoglycan LD-endopeptidase CwlK
MTTASICDPRSEANIATLLPAAARMARALLGRVNDRRLGTGIVVKIIAGTRSYAEQEALYAEGRTAPGVIVTNAPAGYSNHNFGIAFDVGIFNGGLYLGDSPLYVQVGHMGRDLGLEWGGDWTSFPDEPHFQLSSSYSLAAARQLVAEGKWEGLWG